MNNKLKQNLELMLSYDSCAHVSPARWASLLLAILELADVTDLEDFVGTQQPLPKVAGAFTYLGCPVHCRAVEHDSKMHIIFCGYHSGSAGNIGHQYLVFRMNEENQYVFLNQYTSSTVPDWVKRVFNEATATATYPGILSNTLFKRLDAVYKFCVAQGMAEV